jgi:hypothetical protein
VKYEILDIDKISHLLLRYKKTFIFDEGFFVLLLWLALNGVAQTNKLLSDLLVWATPFNTNQGEN